MGLNGLEIKLGTSKSGNDIILYMKQGTRTAICGGSGSGKSNALNNLILMIAKEFHDAGKGEQVQFLGVDLKGGASLAPIASRFSAPICSEPSQVAGLLKDFELLMQKRTKALEKSGKTKIDLFDPDYPLIILVIDELVSLMTCQELKKTQIEELRRLLITITSRCRAANMGFIFSSQSYSENVSLPVAARGNVAQKIILRTEQAICKVLEPEAAEACPAWLLRGEGEFYFSSGNADYIQGKTWFTSDAKAEEVAKRYALDVRQNLGLEWMPDSPFE